MSFWLEDAPPRERPPLDAPRTADVAVVGAGFTGLWTAWELLRREPSLEVVVLESEQVGFGASGRNGGWCSAGLPVSLPTLVERTSRETVRRTVRTLRRAVTEIGELAADARADIGYHRGGILRVARGPHEVATMDASWRTLEALDLLDGHERLDTHALRERVDVARAQGAVFDPHGAVVHPARLVGWLADEVEAAGGVIHGGTEVAEVRPGRAPSVLTPAGQVHASTIVLATEAWTSQLDGWRRAVLPVYSLIVLTEPLDEARQRAIGWDDRECLSSHRLTVDYLSRTPDGRVLFGGRGAPYHYGSAIDPDFDHHEATHAMLRRMLVDWFPALEGIAFTHAWGGPLGMPRDLVPSFTHDPDAGIAAAFGYTGQGVAASRVAGQALAELITTGATELDVLPMVGHRPRTWEPEPLRWLGARIVQTGLQRVDDRAERTGRPPTGRSLAERLLPK